MVRSIEHCIGVMPHTPSLSELSKYWRIFVRHIQDNVNAKLIRTEVWQYSKGTTSYAVWNDSDIFVRFIAVGVFENVLCLFQDFFKCGEVGFWGTEN
jgi:hypothetical protein